MRTQGQILCSYLTVPGDPAPLLLLLTSPGRWSRGRWTACGGGLTGPAPSLICPSAPLSVSWANQLTPLSLRFLACKMGSMVCSERAVVRIQSKECRKNLLCEPSQAFKRLLVLQSFVQSSPCTPLPGIGAAAGSRLQPEECAVSGGHECMLVGHASAQRSPLPWGTLGFGVTQRLPALARQVMELL